MEVLAIDRRMGWHSAPPCCVCEEASPSSSDDDYIAIAPWKSEQPSAKEPMPSLRMRRRCKTELQLKVPDSSASAQRAASPLIDFHADLEEEFTIREVLGQGGTSLVQMAIRRCDGVEVALKRLFTGGDPEVVNMAVQEFDILRSLCHRNVIRALDLKVEDTCAIVVTEFFRGRTLQDAVAMSPNGHFDEDDVRRLALGLFCGLDHLHSQKVVHRDVKPQNIMVTCDLRQVKIIDFNSARSSQTGFPLSPAGTRMYAAPEALLGETPSESSDVWAAGLCLYFALSGKLPQKRDKCSSVSRLGSVALNKVDFSKEPFSRLSSACVSFLHRCLVVDAATRPSASELLRDPWLASCSALSANSETSGEAGDLLVHAAVAGG
jgi:serine/threonine protein kinase